MVYVTIFFLKKGPFPIQITKILAKGGKIIDEAKIVEKKKDIKKKDIKKALNK